MQVLGPTELHCLVPELHGARGHSLDILAKFSTGYCFPSQLSSISTRHSNLNFLVIIILFSCGHTDIAARWLCRANSISLGSEMPFFSPTSIPTSIVRLRYLLILVEELPVLQVE